MARSIARIALIFLVVATCIATSAHVGAGQSAPAPAADCTGELVELFPCLDFLTNSSITSVVPTCCSALTNVSTSSPFCLCQLISPAFSNQSAQLGINDTRALQLPGLCSLNIGPANCVAILGPSTAPAPLGDAVASGPAPIVPAPAISPLASLTPSPSPAPGAEAPVSSPESSPAPGPSVDCSSEISSLSGCLNFLSGLDPSPTGSCCTNFGTVVNAAPECLCTLVDSPIASSFNATLALELPGLCSVSASLSQCAGVGSPTTIPVGTEAPGGSPSHGYKSSASSSFYMVIALCVVAVAHALQQ